jgi:DNA-binding NtrC family response regulator
MREVCHCARYTPEPMNASFAPILIVEDDEVFMNLLATELRGAGWDTLTATSAPEACRVLQQEHVSLVLLDWNLSKPGVPERETGSVVLKTCRAVDPLIPVIVMSGERAFDVRTDAVLNDADSYLEKPFSMSLLVGHVSRWLKRRDGEQTPRKSGRSDEPPPGGLSISSLLDG